MAFNTGNAVGSTDPRDLSDNAENLDRFANGTNAAYDDRLGVSRKSLAGMESDFATDQSERATTFANFLASSGYVGTGTGGAIEDYAGGIEITEYNQLIRESGEFYRAKASLSLPYTTTGTWLGDDEARFVSVGDAALRQEIGSGIFRADSLATLESTPGRFDGDAARLVSGTGRDGDFRWNSSDLSSTLVLASATSDSVDDTTDTINDADHPFSDGDGVVTQTTVNGLTAQTVYWVVNSTSGTYQLSATFGGGAIDLTGTTNVTIDHLLDPRQGIWVTPSSDKTGAGGAWMRQYDSMTPGGGISADWFGTVADDATDDGGAIQSSINYTESKGGGRVLFSYEAYRADELEFKPGVSLIGQTWKMSAAEEGLYTRITSQRATDGNCFYFNVGGASRQWMGTIENMYFRYSGASDIDLLRIEHAYAINTKNVRLLGVNTGDGLILSDVFDGSMEDTLITNFARTATITNSGAIDNSNNISFRRFHCETFFEYGLSIDGTGLSQFSNNKLHFYHLKLEGRPDGTGVANLRTTGVNDVFIYGGHASITGAATPPTSYSFFDVGDNTRGLFVFGMQVRDNANANQVDSVIKTSGTVEGVQMFLSVRQDGPAMVSGLIHYASGSAEDVEVDFTALAKNVSTPFALETIAPVNAHYRAGQKYYGDLEMLGESDGEERSVTFKRSDSADFYQIGRLNAAGNLRFFRNTTEALRLDPNNDVSAVNGFVRSLINGGGFVAKSPDGTFYKLTPPNGGGAASWVAV